MTSTFALGPMKGITGYGKVIPGGKSKTKFFYCQKEGHWKKDCWKRKAEEAKESTHQLVRNQAG